MLSGLKLGLFISAPPNPGHKMYLSFGCACYLIFRGLNHSWFWILFTLAHLQRIKNDSGQSCGQSFYMHCKEIHQNLNTRMILTWMVGCCRDLNKETAIYENRRWAKRLMHGKLQRTQGGTSSVDQDTSWGGQIWKNGTSNTLFIKFLTNQQDIVNWISCLNI